MCQDIVLSVDYHDENCVIRSLDRASGAEQLFSIPTCAQALREVVAKAVAVAQPRGGQVVWIQESTTGWARVKGLLGSMVRFDLANVLQMPLPPKARRRKTDKIDTARMQREFLSGTLPLAHQPPPWWRQVRRLVGYRENLVNRRTALRNWINRYLAHETWQERSGLWSAKGVRRLRALDLPAWDRVVVEGKLAELEHLGQELLVVEKAILDVYSTWPEAQRVDAIKGIAEIAAVSILARIGPVERFATAEHLIAFAGLAPGLQESDRRRRDGHIGGGGTDVHLRYYLIEASLWARRLPRYRATYERMAKRRGNKIGRLVVARMLLRSIYKMLRDGVEFEGTGRAVLAPV
jgi:transposase